MSSSSDSSTTVERNDPELGLERTETTSPIKLSKLRMVYDQSAINVEVSHYPYKGSGTEQDPYLVEWIPNDPRNPITWPDSYKWFIALTNALSTLSIAFVSSGYTGGIDQILMDFRIGTETATAGVTLFVLGFAIGPLLWAPLSELYGRQILFTVTYAAVTAFNAGAAGAKNIQTLLVLRFFAGAFGSSPLTNAGGVIADMFDAEKRGQASTFFAMAPFMGPVLGPIVGAFVGSNVGWRWVEGVMAIFTGCLWIFQSLLIPETYGPVLLRHRAAKLSQKNPGKHYISILDKSRGRPKLSKSLKVALSRPWALLCLEPIVLLISIYMAIIYGTLYLCFGAFPIIFEEVRHWSQSIASLAFVPVAIGITCGAAYNLWDNKRYVRVSRQNDGDAPPETRLPPAMLGSILLPIGLFWIAWSSSGIHWIMPMIGAGIFGCSIILVFLSCMNYLIDSYTIYAASVLAANSVLRSLFGAAFPLFTIQMYHNLGVHWAGSIPAFLGILCLPFPFLFYKYGGPIRMRCKYAAQAHQTMEMIRKSQRTATAEEAQKMELEAENDGEFGPTPSRPERRPKEHMVPGQEHTQVDFADNRPATSEGETHSTNEKDETQV